MRQSPMLEYSVAEFECRKAVFTERMQNDGLDYIMATTKTMVCFLTGLRSVAFRSKLHSPALVFMNKEGKWGIVGSPNGVGTAYYTTCLDEGDFYFYDSTGRSGVGKTYLEALSYTLQHLGMTKGRIGCEMSAGFHLHMDLSLFKTLREKFPELEFVDASDAFRDILADKSELELKNMRIAEGYHETTSRESAKLLIPGKMTEKEFAIKFIREGYIAGNELFINLSLVSGPERALCIDCPPSEKVVISDKPGTVVRAEGYTIRRELNTPFIANYIVGGIQPEQQEAWDLANAMLKCGLNAVKAGAAAGSIPDAIAKCAADAGKTDWNGSKGFAGSVIGWSREDGPLLKSGNDFKLRENMVMTVFVAVLHPSVGEIMLRQNIIVTADGYKYLGDDTSRPFFI